MAFAIKILLKTNIGAEKWMALIIIYNQDPSNFNFKNAHERIISLWYSRWRYTALVYACHKNIDEEELGA